MTSDSLVPLSTASNRLQRLSEVSRLESLLADQVLSTQIASQPIPKAHIHALLDAAIVLDKFEMELPLLIEQMDLKLEDNEAEAPEQVEMEEPREASSENEEAGARRLAWLFRPFQDTKV